jgi:hypothetical protein
VDIAIDADSNIYFCGSVQSVDAPIPTTPGAFLETFSPTRLPQGYVAKMNGTGTQVLWATYLGGDESSDTVWGIAVDAARAVYVAGQTGSNDFPVTPGAFATTIKGQGDGFVTKLLPDASGLAWSTYLGSGPFGGGGYTENIAVDLAGNAHVAGWANEPGWPTTPDAFQTFFIGPFPQSDATLTKLNAFGELLVYSTWFGGDGTDYNSLVALDGAGQPHLACLAFSPDIAVSPGAYDTRYGGTGDMVVAEFDLPLLPWRVLGGGLKGLKDTPNLAGAGSLTPGSPTRLSVRASPSKPAWAVLGFSELYLPIIGGTLVPWPNYILPFATNASGAIDVTFGWPADFVPGMDVVFQFWVLDPGAPFGLSATNGLKAMP